MTKFMKSGEGLPLVPVSLPEKKISAFQDIFPFQISSEIGF